MTSGSSIVYRLSSIGGWAFDMDHVAPGSSDVGFVWSAFTRGYHFNLYDKTFENPQVRGLKTNRRSSYYSHTKPQRHEGFIQALILYIALCLRVFV